PERDRGSAGLGHPVHRFDRPRDEERQVHRQALRAGHGDRLRARHPVAHHDGRERFRARSRNLRQGPQGIRAGHERRPAPAHPGEGVVSLATPMTSALKAELARNSKLKAWQLRTVRRSGFQTYLVKTQLESERWVENLACEATVFVANGDKLGRAVVTLRPEESADFAARVDEAAYMASLGGDSPWELPRAGSWPKVEM